MTSKVWDNRIAPRQKKSGKYPFDFKAPSYDNRTSCSMAAGDDYGIGFNQSCGRYHARGLSKGPIPQGVHTTSAKGFIERRDIEG